MNFRKQGLCRQYPFCDQPRHSGKKQTKHTPPSETKTKAKQTKHTPPNETKTKANKTKQNNPGWSWACKPTQVFHLGYFLVYSQHFLCPDLKTSTTQSQEHRQFLSINTNIHFKNFLNYSPQLPTQIHFNLELRASEQIVTAPKPSWHTDQGVTYKKTPNNIYSVWFHFFSLEIIAPSIQLL